MDQVRLKEVELYLKHTSTSEVSSQDIVHPSHKTCPVAYVTSGSHLPEQDGANLGKNWTAITCIKTIS